MFVELMRRNYLRGCYHTEPVLFALSDIVRCNACLDDYDFTNVITKDGKVHTITARYEDVVRKQI